MLHKRHWITKSSQQISINTINPIQKKNKKIKKKLNKLGEPKTNQLLLIRPRVTVQLIVGHVQDNTKIQKHQYKKNNKKKRKKKKKKKKKRTEQIETSGDTKKARVAVRRRMIESKSEIESE